MSDCCHGVFCDCMRMPVMVNRPSLPVVTDGLEPDTVAPAMGSPVTASMTMPATSAGWHSVRRPRSTNDVSSARTVVLTQRGQ